MNPELTAELDHLLDDIRTNPTKLATLFWLRSYTVLAEERATPRIRWAKLSGFVSRTAREFGINGLDHAPGRALLTDYALFEAVPIDSDGAPVSDSAQLRALDLGRSYEIQLRTPYQPELDGVTAWVMTTWQELRANEQTPSGLAPVLARWAPEGRSGLLPALIEAQAVSGGWLPRAVLAQIGEALRVPLVEVYGVATYYSMLYTEPVGKNIIRVCDDIRCYLAGSHDVLHQVKNVLWVKEHHTTADSEFTLETVPCLGHCDVGCAMQVNERTYEKVTPENVIGLLRAPEQPPLGIAEGARLLKNINDENLHTLDGYLAHGGFTALRQALSSMSPVEVVAAVKESGLVGRGGAAFPTWLKWELARKAIQDARVRGEPQTDSALPRESSPGYLVCNADESETGTFKDRILLERNPWQVIEGVLLAAYALGASYGYIYIRGEYPLAHQRIRAALAEGHKRNFIGSHILGTDFSFELEIRLGAGAYECGEETALFESIEGKRGEPRTKPPFPTQAGLFGRPTVINNVETLSNIPWIVAHGAAEYRSLGTQDSPGTRLTCLSGQVNRGGVYEVPMGTTLRHLIYELGKGLGPDRQLQAVLVGGAAGTFLTPDEIDVPLAFESLSAIRATFGSGAVLVFDDTADLTQALYRIARFFRDESCGKCFPCQIGTQRQFEIMSRLTAHTSRRDDRAILFDTGIVMKDASLCGLGQFAATAILSAYDKGLV